MGMSALPTASNLMGEETDDVFHYLEGMQDDKNIQAFNNLAPSSTGSPRGGTSEMGMSMMPTGSELQAAEAAFGSLAHRQDGVQTSSLPPSSSLSAPHGTSEMGMSMVPTGSELQAAEAAFGSLAHHRAGVQTSSLPPSSTASGPRGTSEMGLSVMPTGSELQAAEAAFGNLTKRAGEVAHDTPRSPQKPTTPQEGFQSFGFDESDSSGTSASRGVSYHPSKGLEIKSAFADFPSESPGLPNPQDSRLLRALEDADVSSFGPSPALYEGPAEPFTTSTPQTPRDEPGTSRGGPQTPRGGIFSKIKKDLQRTFSGQE
jgi:hypothetical protein